MKKLMTAPTITRFAPSPTGFLHVGHAYSALFSEKEARTNNGRFLVRMEDIDKDRSAHQEKVRNIQKMMQNPKGKVQKIYPIN